MVVIYAKSNLSKPMNFTDNNKHSINVPRKHSSIFQNGKKIFSPLTDR